MFDNVLKKNYIRMDAEDVNALNKLNYLIQIYSVKNTIKPCDQSILKNYYTYLYAKQLLFKVIKNKYNLSDAIFNNIDEFDVENDRLYYKEG